MEVLRLYFVMAVFALLSAIVFPSVNAQVPAPAPAPSNDGAAIDQGIAYVLMLLALALTYIIH
ncbi:hypothetical protein RJ640_027349 [Escallonia rubra]|uniref:Uncharacterized protein n=1 Tax=Escallonia rubra TaxID=112253 RepID=A0AA88QGZ6_9ASTE|nr:hypothetical protein RJ640_027349 [Escallonia rubra]